MDKRGSYGSSRGATRNVQERVRERGFRMRESRALQRAMMRSVQETSRLASEDAAAARLSRVLRRAPLVMEALEAARAVGAPDWLLYERRVLEKKWRTRWPKMSYVAGHALVI
jgi:hypothetical protein